MGLEKIKNKESARKSVNKKNCMEEFSKRNQ